MRKLLARLAADFSSKASATKTRFMQQIIDRLFFANHMKMGDT